MGSNFAIVQGAGSSLSERLLNRRQGFTGQYLPEASDEGISSCYLHPF
jgi:hypothetical protein